MAAARKSCNKTASSSENSTRSAEEPELEDHEGVLFYVNRDGFPTSKKTYERMWAYAQKIHPEGARTMQNIRQSKSVEKVPYPAVPVFTPVMAVPEKLELVQKYLMHLQYNHTGTQFFEIKKYRPLSGLMDTAREIIRDSLPIKCLEAVIVSLYLTSSISEIQRFTVSFKTQFASSTHRHVVLGVHYNGRYGSLGLSRREDLMYKPLKFQSLSDLLEDFIKSYNTYLHTVKKLKLSLPIVHDLHSCEKIYWKYLTLNPCKASDADLKKILDKYSREVKSTVNSYRGNSPRKVADEPLHAVQQKQRASNQQPPAKDSVKQDGSVFQVRV